MLSAPRLTTRLAKAGPLVGLVGLSLVAPGIISSNNIELHQPDWEWVH